MGADVNSVGELFSNLEIDTIGEIMNISMGSAATAASTLLDNKVTITTPVVEIAAFDEFQIDKLEPAIAVEIKYVEGIFGSNILILKKEDVRLILGKMMMTEIDPDFEIDEMAESAICELMNQMMGSSATVLSCFLGRAINISTPTTVSIDKLDQFKIDYFAGAQNILTIAFTLSIVDLMESTFMCAMQIDLAKEIIDVSLNFDSEAPAEEEPPPPAPPTAGPKTRSKASPNPPPSPPAPPPSASTPSTKTTPTTPPTPTSASTNPAHTPSPPPASAPTSAPSPSTTANSTSPAPAPTASATNPSPSAPATPPP